MFPTPTTSQEYSTSKLNCNDNLFEILIYYWLFLITTLASSNEIFILLSVKAWLIHSPPEFLMYPLLRFCWRFCRFLSLSYHCSLICSWIMNNFCSFVVIIVKYMCCCCCSRQKDVVHCRTRFEAIMEQNEKSMDEDNTVCTGCNQGYVTDDFKWCW